MSVLKIFYSSFILDTFNQCWEKITFDYKRLLLSSCTQRTGTQLVSRTMHLPEQQWSQCGVWERSREPERWARLASPSTRPCPAHSQQPGIPAIREALQPNTHFRSVYKNIYLKLCCDQLVICEFEVHLTVLISHSGILASFYRFRLQGYGL